MLQLSAPEYTVGSRYITSPLLASVTEAFNDKVGAERTDTAAAQSKRKSANRAIEKVTTVQRRRNQVALFSSMRLSVLLAMQIAATLSEEHLAVHIIPHSHFDAGKASQFDCSVGLVTR